MKRGFTVLELLVSASTLGLVAAALAALQLEGRVSAAKSEGQVQLQREGSLAAEWVAREIRSAAKVEPREGGVVLTDGDRKVELAVEDGHLIRGEGDERRPIAKGVRLLEVAAVRGGYRVHLLLERRLLEGRNLTLERSIFIGSRR